MTHDRVNDPLWLRDWGPDEEELPEVSEFESEQASISWFSRFTFNRYNWSDEEFIRENTGHYSYRVIPLTKGYFTIVSRHDYRRMTRFPDGSPKKWCADVQVDRETGAISKIYAVRTGRGGEPRKIYAHRELIGCIEDSGVVDHINAWSLDNRRGTPENPINLRYVRRGENMHNALRMRTIYDLPRGVELRGKNKKGMPLYGGMYCKRHGQKVRTIRSRRKWLSPESAGRWYQSQMARLHKQRAAWAHEPNSVNFPIFPRDDSEYVPF